MSIRSADANDTKLARTKSVPSKLNNDTPSLAPRTDLGRYDVSFNIEVSLERR